MSPQTVAKLYNEFEEIIAIKEATGSLDIATEIISLCDIVVLSGDDSLTLPLIAVGAKGVVSVLSNLSPKMVKAITAPALEGNFADARVAHLKTVSSSPSPYFPLLSKGPPTPHPLSRWSCYCAMCLTTICTYYRDCLLSSFSQFKLFKNLFIEPNPQPAKAAMQMMGMCNDAVRLPLVPACQETRDILKALLIETGLLKAE
jgi:dihydrodipicolinate synthase/N-acetylneuraminate lyase